MESDLTAKASRSEEQLVDEDKGPELPATNSEMVCICHRRCNNVCMPCKCMHAALYTYSLAEVGSLMILGKVEGYLGPDYS